MKLKFRLQKNDDIVAAIKKELKDVKAANAKLSLRIGDEIVDDSDDSILSDGDDEYSTKVNTRHHQLDAQFSGPFYFLTNVCSKKLFFRTLFNYLNIVYILIKMKGDRLYLDEELKLKLSLVELLKNMNSKYPKTSADFDTEFLYRAVQPMFSRDEMKKCIHSNNLRQLNASHLRFLKGT